LGQNGIVTCFSADSQCRAAKPLTTRRAARGARILLRSLQSRDQVVSALDTSTSLIDHVRPGAQLRRSRRRFLFASIPERQDVNFLPIPGFVRIHVVEP
jgi:hypothetical protein